MTIEKPVSCQSVNIMTRDTVKRRVVSQKNHPTKGTLKKKPIESLTAVKPPRAGVSGLVVIVLRLFLFHAPKLFVCLQEAPKHILFSLLTPCTTYFPSYLTLKISDLTSPDVIFVKSFLTVSSCFYGQNRSKF